MHQFVCTIPCVRVYDVPISERKKINITILFQVRINIVEMYDINIRDVRNSSFELVPKKIQGFFARG
jgi:hypothetical protein